MDEKYIAITQEWHTKGWNARQEEVDELQKRIDEALTWLTRNDIRAINMAREILQGGDLKSLRGEHENSN